MFCEIPDFGRCCFCMPLRRGVLVFGYINVVLSAFWVGLYSYSVHHDIGFNLAYHGAVSEVEDFACIFLYCVEIVFNVVLIYGAHRTLTPYIKVFYYYSITALALEVLLQILDFIQSWDFISYAIQILTLFLASFCIHVYLIVLVRSLLRKIEMSGHVFENQLHQIVTGELPADGNGVYPSIVLPNDA